MSAFARLAISRRLLIALGAGLASALYVLLLYGHQAPGVVSDWDATWVGARALLRGQNPYTSIPNPPWPWGLNYPMPAVILSVPFAFLPLPLARALFVAVGTVLFTWAVLERGTWRLYLVVSGAMYWSWIPVQWAPVLIGSVLTPGLAWILAAKPTMGFALWVAYPRRSAIIGGLLLVGLGFLLQPHWVQPWQATVARLHHEPHALRPGGFLLLLALLRWRRPEGRLLAALSLVPQTTALYEALPLGLVAESRPQAAGFAALTVAAHLLYQAGPQGPWPVGAEYQWWVMLFLIYLPTLGLVLSRPNVLPLPEDTLQS
jgi:hypothetical protein